MAAIKSNIFKEKSMHMLQIEIMIFNKSLLIIISSPLSLEEEHVLLDVLSSYKSAIAFNDVKRIRPPNL